ncbi:MAG: HRDC domain-containing protein [Acidimicrobiales bacterium]
MTVSFEWVADAGRLDDLVDELVEAPAYGLDTEFHREKTYHPQLALLQLAGPGGIALVDPLAVDLAPLAKVLDGPGLAVLHAADQDLEVLQKACGTVPSRLFDTQLAAGFLGMSSLSLVALVERVLGRRLVKGDRLTDWTVRPLTGDQQAYAASDVIHLLELRERLVADLVARDRLGWTEDECELLRTRARWDTPVETAWWRVKEARSLRGQARGVAQEVAEWRERRASAVDRPARFILPDLALAAVAQRPPRRVQDMASVRGMDGRYLKGEAGPELLAAVARGQALGEDELRLPPTDDVDRRLRPAVTLVSAWIGQLAGDLDLDPVLLATRADLHAFLRKDPDARLSTGWRRELVGDAVARLVDGRAAVAFDGRELVLEDRIQS